MSKVKPDSRVPQGSYLIANLGNVVPETKLTMAAESLLLAAVKAVELLKGTPGCEEAVAALLTAIDKARHGNKKVVE